MLWITCELVWKSNGVLPFCLLHGSEFQYLVSESLGQEDARSKLRPSCPSGSKRTQVSIVYGGDCGQLIADDPGARTVAQEDIS